MRYENIRVDSGDLNDVAVILLGHGTKLNADSATPVFLHSSALEDRGVFGKALPAFWKQEPYIKDVIRHVSQRKVVIVPMFISEGYFSDEVIPRELGFASGAGPDSQIESDGRILLYARAIGTHPKMTDVVLSRAAQITSQFPVPNATVTHQITLFIAGHGTSRNAKSRRSVEHQVDLIKRSGAYANAHAIFMEEQPFIKDYTGLAKTRFAVVVPFFISDGLHVREDIPVMLGETEENVRTRLASGKPTWINPTEVRGVITWYSPAVGTDPGIEDVITERVRESLKAAH